MTTPDSTHPAPEPQRYNPAMEPVKYLTEPVEDALRPHSYDGIQEYDKRLPRWWLLTLYGAMVFAVLYWAYYETYGLGSSPALALQSEMAENTARAAQKSGVIDDASLWKMSLDPQEVAAGKTTFETTCAACHKPDLTGLIGPNLLDHEWIHGGHPMEEMKTITEGSLLKGMPAWGPLLGKQKITEVTAYIFSHHKPGEEIVAVPGWIPPAGLVPPPAPAP
ncbi:MAG: cbb3-type cytochrome c oxidase N-terminal domain-containing protein [Chthoniobacter sp.]|uniref:cbb3-type cytochrome c oxidase N-terminal domain-containing protein n=1 Tax=Chthoniobacter sp. TaxID=2510640 RepID=UPI0032A9850E